MKSRQDAKDAKARVPIDEPHPELDRSARAVIGAAIEVHRHLGPGFIEHIYERAMIVELGSRGLHVEHQVPIPITYKGIELAESRLDLLVDGHVVVELKAFEHIVPLHVAQVISYLKAGAFQLALLINFNVPVLRDGIRRIISSG